MRTVKSANSKRPLSTIPKTQSIVMELNLSPQVKYFKSSLTFLLETLYIKKCQELKIQFQPDQMARFQERIIAQQFSHTLDLSELSLPGNCIPLINKIIKQIPFVILSQNPLYEGVKFLQLQMVSLSLCNCGIGQRGFSILFQTLSKNQTLYNLNIGNPFSNERNRLGIALNQLVEALKINKILAILNISGCGIYDIRKLNHGLQQNRNLIHINVSDNELKDAVVLPPNLEFFEAQNNQFAIQSVQICEQLCLGQETIHLSELNLKRNKLSIHQLFAILELLERNTHLKKLILDENTFIGENNICICNYLVYNNHLEYLSLRNCSLTQNFIEQLASGLCRNSNLKVLDLSKNLIGDEGAMALLPGLEGQCNLKSIFMKRCGLSDIGGLELFKTFLKGNMKEYDFSSNLLQDQTAMYAIQLMKKNKDITKMNFKKNLNSYETNKQIQKLLQDNLQEKKKNEVPYLKGTVLGMNDFREQQDFIEKKKDHLLNKKQLAENEYITAQSQVSQNIQIARDRTSFIEDRVYKLRDELQALTKLQLGLDKQLGSQLNLLEDEQKQLIDNTKQESNNVNMFTKQIQESHLKLKGQVQFYKQKMDDLRLQDGIQKRRIDQLKQEQSSIIAQMEFLKNKLKTLSNK